MKRRMSGEIEEKHTVTLNQQSDQIGRIGAGLVRALEDFPEARDAVGKYFGEDDR